MKFFVLFFYVKNAKISGKIKFSKKDVQEFFFSRTRYMDMTRFFFPSEQGKDFYGGV